MRLTDLSDHFWVEWLCWVAGRSRTAPKIWIKCLYIFWHPTLPCQHFFIPIHHQFFLNFDPSQAKKCRCTLWTAPYRLYKTLMVLIFIIEYFNVDKIYDLYKFVIFQWRFQILKLIHFNISLKRLLLISKTLSQFLNSKNIKAQKSRQT